MLRPLRCFPTSIGSAPMSYPAIFLRRHGLISNDLGKEYRSARVSGAVPLPVPPPASASLGGGGGVGLPIIGKLLGHTQSATTARYAHLDNDPLRRATESIGSRIAAALDGKHGATVVEMKKHKDNFE